MLIRVYLWKMETVKMITKCAVKTGEPNATLICLKAIKQSAASMAFDDFDNGIIQVIKMSFSLAGENLISVSILFCDSLNSSSEDNLMAFMESKIHQMISLLNTSQKNMFSIVKMESLA